MELRPGTLIADKLRLLAPLGQGGMGVVWRAHHLPLDTEVAVKLIRPDRAAADPALVARFEREARATARITNPHVVRVMDFGTIDSAVPYLVMELLEGFSLAELLERGGRLSLASTLSLVEQVGSALESAHQCAVVHRDIKPHNLFITENSQGHALFVKVVDFGVAKMLSDSQVPGVSPSLTETGMVMGSPPYMSPEQIEGSRHVDLRSDLWSLGVIVYQCLTGELPFRGGSFVAVGAAILKGTYRPARELRPSLPRFVDDWLAKALCVDPEGRFSSAREMVDALAVSYASYEPSSRRDGAEPASASLAYVETEPALPAGMVEQGSAGIGTEVHPPPAAAPQARRKPVVSRRHLAWTLPAVTLVIAGAGYVLTTQAGVSSSECPAGMVRIDGGLFRMGSAPSGETPSDEMPAHDVRLSSYCLDEKEVTVAQYSKCASCELPAPTVEFEGLTPNGRTFWSEYCNRDPSSDHPVNCIDWHQAEAYCKAQGKRLPSEAEWEFAARGPEAHVYPWGREPPTGAHLNACGRECGEALSRRLAEVGKGPWPRLHDDDDRAVATAAVGSHPSGKSWSGAWDLAGNVWEWTQSHYCPYDRPECGDSRRVLRGGGWDTVESQFVRAAHRRPSAPTARGWSIGFRCARSP